MSNPTVRLVLRAIIAGVLALAAQLQASDNWDATLLRSGIVAAILAALEYLTPLNQLVGPGKTETPTAAGTPGSAPPPTP
jgi:hypothetical protein